MLLHRIRNLMLTIKVAQLPWPFPEWVNAVTIWPVIFYEPPIVGATLVHERYHWKDQLRWLVLPWFAIYLVLLPFYGGGRKHPLERAAYKAEDAYRKEIE